MPRPGACRTERVSDAATTLADAKGWTRKFMADRDWWQFHSIRNDVLALTSEVGELADIVRYKTDESLTASMKADDSTARAFRDELADILWDTLLLAQSSGVDLASALEGKIKKTELKYPVKTFKGIARKYNATE